MPRLTPSSWAYGTSRSMARADRSRAPSRSLSPAAVHRHEHQRGRVQRRRLLDRLPVAPLGNRRLVGIRGCEEPAPAQRGDAQPDSATSRQAWSSPTSASCSRQIPMAPRPASTQPWIASGSDQETVVRWLSESRLSAGRVVTGSGRRPRTADRGGEPRGPGPSATAPRWPARTRAPGGGSSERTAGRPP